MKGFINKLRTAFAVIKADKSVVFIDKDECVIRYVCGVSEEDIESLTDLDF